MKSLVQNVLDLAETLAPLVVPGSAAAIEAAKAAARIIENVRLSTSSDLDQMKLRDALNDLQERVNANVDEAIDLLEG